MEETDRRTNGTGREVAEAVEQEEQVKSDSEIAV